MTLPSLAGGSRTPTIVPFTFRARCAALYLPYISPIPPLYLPYISPVSPLYLYAVFFMHDEYSGA